MQGIQFNETELRSEQMSFEQLFERTQQMKLGEEGEEDCSREMGLHGKSCDHPKICCKQLSLMYTGND